MDTRQLEVMLVGDTWIAWWRENPDKIFEGATWYEVWDAAVRARKVSP